MIKVIPLVENTTSDKNLKCRHGLCLYIETARHKLLFDVGPNGAFLENAARLGIDIRQIGAVFLSHGHKDHAGGLKAFLAVNKTARIYMRKTAAEPHYIKVLGIPISVSADKSLISGERFVFTDEITEIDEELTVFSDVKPIFPLPSSDKKLFMKRGGKIIPDDFGHEQSLIVTTGGEKFLFCGCSHAGIVNIRNKAENVAGGEISAVFGGFHLYNPPSGKYESADYIAQTAAALAKTQSDYYTCHCTGEQAFEQMKPVLVGKLHYFRTGSHFER